VTVAGTETTPPTVALVSPDGTAPLMGTVTVTATASDTESGVAGVQFQVDGVDLGSEDATAPYEVSWTTPSPDGTYTLTAIARDNANNTATSNPVNVTVDNTDPTVSVTSPADLDTVTGTVSVAASASDTSGVVGVQFQVDGVDLGSEDTTAPYEASWATPSPDGAYVLTAIARDSANNTATSTPVTVTVDNTAPTISITNPADLATVSGTVSVAASASDASGVVGVQFVIDSANFGAEDTSSPYSVDWDTADGNYADGQHILSAVATDLVGNQATASNVLVTVSNSSSGGTVSYSEDFASGTAIGWSESTGSSWDASGGIYESLTTADGTAVYGSETWDTDYTYEVRVKLWGTGYGNQTALLYNYVDASNYYELRFFNDDTVEMWKTVSGHRSAPRSVIGAIPDPASGSKWPSCVMVTRRRWQSEKSPRCSRHSLPWSRPISGRVISGFSTIAANPLSTTSS